MAGMVINIVRAQDAISYIAGRITIPHTRKELEYCENKSIGRGEIREIGRE